MNKKLISMAIATVMAASSTQVLAGQYGEESTSSELDYQSIGIGAVSGAMLAGPTGMIVGGLVGSMFDWSEIDSGVMAEAAAVQGVELAVDDSGESTNEAVASSESDSVMVASAGPSIPIIDVHHAEPSQKVQEIIANDLSMKLYFKRGSVDVEDFYSNQLAAVSQLMVEMPNLELNLDGYSDRVGSKQDNLRLSAERLDSVRDYLVNQGVDENRINIRAHGEANFLSAPGDLADYMFDRRVVVSFKESSNSVHSNVAVLTDSSGL